MKNFEQTLMLYGCEVDRDELAQAIKDAELESYIHPNHLASVYLDTEDGELWMQSCIEPMSICWRYPSVERLWTAPQKDDGDYEAYGLDTDADWKMDDWWNDRAPYIMDAIITEEEYSRL